MELWITEYQTPALGYSCKVLDTLRVEQTPYQHLCVVETEQFGTMLLLDNMVMTTDEDEFVYHEMISLVALNSHPKPEQVLIIGGGDGGALREVVRHPLVKRGVLVEIDDRVVQASRDFFPNLSCAFNDPKSEVIIGDGIDYVKHYKNHFDVIIVDSTEPVGPAVELFSREFYEDVFSALRDDGMLVVQSESPFVNRQVIKKAYQGVRSTYPMAHLYLASIPTYPSGLWSFTVGSKKYNPTIPINNHAAGCKYYNLALHQAVFQLPSFVQQVIED